MAHLLEKPPPPKPVLTIIRQRVRPVFASNRKTKEMFEQELVEWDQSNTGCIPTDMMKDLLDSLQVQFEGNEWNDFKKVFGIGRGNCHFNYRKLLKGLDLGTPQDHVEPEQFVDQLPQPYRMIVKVLENDILEVGWDMICKAHPELLEDESDLTRARKLTSAAQATPASVVEGAGTVTCVNWEKSGTILFAGTISGHVVAISVEREIVITSLAIFTDIPYGVSCLSNVVGNLGLQYPLRMSLSAAQPPPVVITPPDPSPPKSRAKSRKTASRQQSNPKSEDDGSRKDLANKKSTRIIMVEAFYESTRHTVKMTSAGVLDIKSSILSISMASDGRYLAMTTQEGSVLISILPEQNVLEVTKEKMDEIDEDKEVEFAKRQKGPVTIDQPILIIPAICAPTFELLLSDDAEVVLPNFQCVASFLTTSKDPTSNQEPEPFPKVKSIAIWRHNSNIWKKYTLPLPQLLEEMAKEEAGSESPVEPKDKKKGGKGKKDVEEEEEDPFKIKTVEPVVELELLLPGSITCSALDTSTTLLALGTKEGGVFVYDLQTGLLLAALEQHQLSTTGVCFFQRRYLVSVSEDERTHFYDLLPGPNQRPCLLSYRHDFSKPVCAVASLSSMPIVFAQDVEGKIACYDIETQDLLGSLDTKGPEGERPLNRHISYGMSLRINPCDSENMPRDERTQIKYFIGQQAVWCASSDYLSILCAPDSLLHYRFPQVAEDFSQSMNPELCRPKSPDPDIEDSKTNKLTKKSSMDFNEHPEPLGSPGPGGIPQTALLSYSACEVVLQLCPGVLAVCGEDAEIEAVRGVFRKLSPEQRRDVSSLPESMMPAANVQSLTSLKTFGSNTSSRSQLRSSSRLSAFDMGNKQPSRQTSKPSTARQSSAPAPGGRKASTFVGNSVSMGALATMGSVVRSLRKTPTQESTRASNTSLPPPGTSSEFGVPTEENMNVMMGGELDPGLPAFRFKTAGLAVKKCLAERHIGKIEREQRIQRRRQELMQIL